MTTLIVEKQFCEYCQGTGYHQLLLGGWKRVRPAWEAAKRKRKKIPQCSLNAQINHNNYNSGPQLLFWPAVFLF